MRPLTRVLLYALALVVIALFLFDHHPAAAQQAAESVAAAPDAPQGPETIEVEIDWLAELQRGGLTILAQGLLSVIGLAVAIERILYIRQRHFAPRALLEKTLPLGSDGDWDAVIAEGRKSKSLLGDIAVFIAEHRDNDLTHVQQGAGDIGVREMRHQLNKVYPLAVVGSLEPLLGLLGTMIGMIEAFALVAIYGDEGGASLLADSIAKALITTAVGLVIAIPAMGIYYWLKQRTLSYMSDLETSVETMIDEWFLKPEGETRRRRRLARRQKLKQPKVAEAEAAPSSPQPVAAAPASQAASSDATPEQRP